MLGLHEWNGCKCSNCDKIRNEQHDLSKDCEKCSKCGNPTGKQHNWSEDCEMCSVCSTIINNRHVWENNKCKICLIDLEVFYNEAIKHFENEEYDKALKDFLKVTSIQPNHANALLFLATVYDTLGENSKSMETFSNANSLSSDSPLAWYRIAKVYVSKGYPNKALKFFLNAITFNANYSEAWNDIAMQLMNKEKIEKAIKCLIKAVYVKPDNIDAWYNLGYMFLKNNNQYNAIVSWKQAAKLGDSEAQQKLTKLGKSWENETINDYSFAFATIKATENEVTIEEILAEIDNNEEDEEKRINRIINELEKLANENNGIIISATKEIHFSKIVRQMKQIGAKRHGSKNEMGNILDIYTLPNGTKIYAGYKNMF
jgi:Tfp pilus assembly protein PilF